MRCFPTRISRNPQAIKQKVTGRPPPGGASPVCPALFFMKETVMNITHLQSAPKVQVPFDARIMHSDGPLEVIHILLQPGEGVPPHDNPFDVIFYVLEGQGELTIGDQNKQVAADSLIAIPSGTLRGWKNVSTAPTRLLVVKLLKQQA